MTSAEVLTATGLSYRQLGWLVRHGVITPKVHGTGPGNPWSWGAEQLPVLRLCAVLRYMGAPVPVLRKVVPTVGQLDEHAWGFRVLVTTDGRLATLLGTDAAGYLVDLAACRTALPVSQLVDGMDDRRKADRRAA
jgi:hypothetical protein